MFNFPREEYEDRFRIVVRVEWILWLYLVAYHFGSPYIGARPISARLDWAIIAGYGLYVLFNHYAVTNWRWMTWAVCQVCLVDTFAIAVIGWRWGGVETFGPSLALLGIVMAVLSVGVRYGFWFTLAQTLWLCGVARLDGMAIVHPWLVTFGIHAFATLSITGALAHLIRTRERTLVEQGEELQQDRRTLQRSVERLTRLTQAQVDSLIRAERLATIGQLAPTIVHDLKNPLGALASVAQSAREDLQRVLEATPNESVAEVAGDLEVMGGQLGRLKEMVQGILNLSRQDKGYEETIDANAAARDALTAVRLQIKAMRVQIDERLAEERLAVRGNQGQLSQVLVNLMWNAAQAIDSEGGGEGIILLATSRDAESDRVLVEVSDTGPGISKRVAGRLFEPFFTTKKTGQGTGLGLYLCREIISRHGGTIEPSHHESGGARFVIELPAAKGAT